LKERNARGTSDDCIEKEIERNRKQDNEEPPSTDHRRIIGEKFYKTQRLEPRQSKRQERGRHES